MSSTHIIKSVQIKNTARVIQLSGMFDVKPNENSVEEWSVNLSLPSNWNVGLIVGPSGSGKTTIANELFSDYIFQDFIWHDEKSILDGFPDDMSVKNIVNLLSSVGFSSPPAWLRPFRCLSNGEQFRVNVARAIAENKEITVIDEFTSVVDRNVAKIASAAVAKSVRRFNKKFVAVSCHYDIAEWLEPDWIYEPATDSLQIGRRLRRPEIKLDIFKVHRSAWELFKKHHYLDTSISVSAQCFCAFWNDIPVAFTSYLHFPHPKTPNMKRDHRTVTLPDYQGVSIGNKLNEAVAQMVIESGARYVSITAHPSMIAYRARSPLWKMIQKPNAKTKTLPGKDLAGQGSGASKSIGLRMRATFEYIGNTAQTPELVT